MDNLFTLTTNVFILQMDSHDERFPLIGLLILTKFFFCTVIALETRPPKSECLVLIFAEVMVIMITNHCVKCLLVLLGIICKKASISPCFPCQCDQGHYFVSTCVYSDWTHQEHFSAMIFKLHYQLQARGC